MATNGTTAATTNTNTNAAPADQKTTATNGSETQAPQDTAHQDAVQHTQQANGDTTQAPSADDLKDVCAVDDNGNPGPVLIDRPVGITKEVELQPGQHYIFGFDKSTALSYVQDGDTLKITFDCGGVLLLKNYHEATAGTDAATFAFSDSIPQGVLGNIVDIKTADQQTEEPQSQLRKTHAEQHAENDHTAHDVAARLAKINTAAGDTDASKLANIEPAAGGTGGAGGHGYGFNSQYNTTAVGPLNPVGVIGATALQYHANFPDQKAILFTEAVVDDHPEIGAVANSVDETNLSGGPLSVSDVIPVDFGHDGPGTLTPDGTFSYNGSVAGGVLTSHGVTVDVTPTADGYEGKAGGTTVFTITIDPNTGDYTFTQFAAIDHADATNPNDVINLVFGVAATDHDGDVANTTVTISVADDAPLASSPAVENVDEHALSGGPIVVNDSIPVDFGQDTPGTVKPDGTSGATGDIANGTLSSGGVAIVITPTADGYVGKAGGTTVFTITFDNTGHFTYTQFAALDHSNPGDNIALKFGVVITDYDGDNVSTDVTVNIKDDVPHITNNDHPTIGHGLEVVDETNLGPITVNGSLAVDSGADKPAVIMPDGTFTSDGSKLNGNLTSHGVAVTVTPTANGYEGKAGGNTVFTLTVNDDGSYQFKLLGVLDHQDGSNPDDVINLHFGVKVTDSDGDSATGSITVQVHDDAPSIAAPAATTINEHNLGPIVVDNNLTVNFGHDGAGNVHPNGVANATGDLANGKLSSGGVDVVINPTATGYEGKAGGATVFTITINPNTGAYEFVLNKPLDHSPNGDLIALHFGAQVTDYDGDKADTTITINVKDDVPTIVDNDHPTIGHGLEVVDETNLGPITVAGAVAFTTGADTPATFGVNGAFTSDGSKLGGQLTSNGVAVDVTQTANGYVGKAGGETIFTITVGNDGHYEFKLLGTLDHNDKMNPDDVINLHFGVKVTDNDGDAANGMITVQVHDDAPVAHNDANTLDDVTHTASGNVITGLNGGPGAADIISHDHISDTVTNVVTKISFGGTTVDVPSTGEAVINGDYGTLHIHADGTYTYEQFSQSVPVSFGETLTFPALSEGVAISGAALNNLGIKDGVLTVPSDSTGTITFDGGITAYNDSLGAYTVGADGTIHAVQMLFANGHNTTDGSSYAFSVGGGETAGFFVVANGDVANGGYPGVDFSQGELHFVYDYGQGDQRDAKVTDSADHISLVYTSPGNVDTVLQGAVYHSTERGDSAAINPDGQVHVISGLTTDGDTSHLRIGFEDLPSLGDHDYGDVVFNLTLNVNQGVCGTDQFTYTLTDGDGDSSNATLTLTCDDYHPVITNAISTVDETNLNPTTAANGVIVADYGHDGPGTIAGNGLFSGGPFTSGGHPVSVAYDVANHTYTGTANGATIFTLNIQPNGQYTFTLSGVLDHPVNPDPNDNLQMQFGVSAKDADGDTTPGTITINVLDDGPQAHNDVNNFSITQVNKDYNINLILDVSGSMAGDKLALLKSSVAHLLSDFHDYQGGDIKVHIVPFSTTSEGEGTFTVTDDGGYASAVAFLNGLTADGFTNYEAPLQQGAAWLNGATANDPITGADTYTYFVSDGEPNRYLNGSGTVTTGDANRVMQEITGTSVNDSHSEVKDIQDLSTKVIAVGIGVDATTLGRLDVIDSSHNALDVQNPNDLDAALQSTNPLVGTATGNVITGLNGGPGAADTPSHDVPNTVTKVSFGGTTVVVDPVNGGEIDGANGHLVIHADGSYTYTLSNGAHTIVNGMIGDQFTYTYTDGDGDGSTATLTLQGKATVGVDIHVNNGVDDVQVSEDHSVFVPVTAHVTNGDGNETMTLTLHGVGTGWGFTSVGWAATGTPGEYKITLPAGTADYNGGFTLTPPHDSDVDLSGLSVTATVTDPDSAGVTSTDGFKVVVDAVVDTPVLTVASPVDFFWIINQTNPSPLNIATHVTDTDGSETVTKVVVHLESPFTNPSGGYTSLDSLGVTLNKGTETAPGVWTINVGTQDATTALAGLTLLTPTTDAYYWAMHDHDHSGTIKVESYVSETNLSGGEYNLADNSTVVVQNIAYSFAVSPLVVDLNGNGIELIGKNAGVMFDMNNNGTADHTTWVGPHDGLLAIDANHDGLINNQSELFGDSASAADGFAKLALYDTNHDGAITSADAQFSNLVVWQDANSDGVSQPGELHNLDYFGITSISLHTTDAGYAAADGYVSQQSVVSYADGHQTTVADAWFSTQDGADNTAQVLDGTDHNDIMLGSSGHDVITGGLGNDVIYGNGGDDVFVFKGGNDTSLDTVKDFHAGDVIDVSGIIGHDPVQDSINDFVFKTESNGNTVISVDASGSGNIANAHAVAVLENVTGLDLEQIIHHAQQQAA